MGSAFYEAITKTSNVVTLIVMKTALIVLLIFAGTNLLGQTIVGTWQLTNEETCFQSQSRFAESDTEKELASGLGSTSKTSVARLISFTNKGNGEEGVFSKGKKKGSGTTSFRYKVSGNELQF